MPVDTHRQNRGPRTLFKQLWNPNRGGGRAPASEAQNGPITYCKNPALCLVQSSISGLNSEADIREIHFEFCPIATFRFDGPRGVTVRAVERRKTSPHPPHCGMQFFKKSEKSRPRPTHLALGIPSHIGVVPLGISAELEPEAGSGGELRSAESRNRRSLSYHCDRRGQRREFPD